MLCNPRLTHLSLFLEQGGRSGVSLYVSPRNFYIGLGLNTNSSTLTGQGSAEIRGAANHVSLNWGFPHQKTRVRVTMPLLST
jgi:hypothetical protein